MTLQELYEKLNEAAPKALSDEYCKTFGAYDNSGVLVNCGGDAKGVLFTLDLTDAVIEKAKAQGANVIVTHHPVIYGKISDVRLDTPLGGRLIACIQAGISIISMHLNVDCAVGGIDDCLADGIFYAASNLMGAGINRVNICRYHTLSQGGYGSVYEVPEITAKALGENLEKVFLGDVRVVGDGGKVIRKVASFCGAGADDSSIGFAIQSGVDAVVTADWKHHLILACYQAGVTVFVMSHYASEEYGFKKYYEKMCKSICVPCAFHREDALL